MKTSRSKVMSALLSVGVICLLALLSTYSTSAQQAKGKADTKAKANPRIRYIQRTGNKRGANACRNLAIGESAAELVGGLGVHSDQVADRDGTRSR